ncbi:MAG TPA: cytochrome P450 [Streptosporangiaceae bacterium]|jgi:cytochrome P450
MRMTQPAREELVPLADIDLFPAGFYRTGDPHAAWRALRSQAPVWRQPAPDGTPFWSVTRYDDVVRILRDSTRFSSEHSTMLTVLHGDSAAGRAIHLMDPPRHRIIRAPSMHALSMQVMNKHEARIRERVRAMIAAAAAERETDFARLATAIPMAVTGEILGIPEQHWADVARWTIAGLAPDDPYYRAGLDRSTLQVAHTHLFTLLAGLIEARRERPADDLISVLVSLDIDGRPATDDDVLVNCYSFIMGATPTVPQAASHLLLVLLEQPALWRQLRDDAGLLPTITEEALRWATPINHLLRRTAGPVRLGDEILPPGSLVAAWLAAANRDEAVFADPYVFDPRRHPNPHLAFGAGPHRCIGNASARVGLSLLVAELAAQVSSLEQAGPAQHLESNFLNGITSLPVVLHPAARLAGQAAG